MGLDLAVPAGSFGGLRIHRRLSRGGGCPKCRRADIPYQDG